MPGCVNHVWEETYYGLKCQVCGVFVPSGCEPWMPIDEEDDEEEDDEEEFYGYGTCETCGAEYGPGWSSCFCDELDQDDLFPEEIGDNEAGISQLEL